MSVFAYHKEPTWRTSKSIAKAWARLGRTQGKKSLDRSPFCARRYTRVSHQILQQVAPLRSSWDGSTGAWLGYGRICRRNRCRQQLPCKNLRTEHPRRPFGLEGPRVPAGAPRGRTRPLTPQEPGEILKFAFSGIFVVKILFAVD